MEWLVVVVGSLREVRLSSECLCFLAVWPCARESHLFLRQIFGSIRLGGLRGSLSDGKAHPIIEIRRHDSSICLVNIRFARRLKEED